MIRMNGEKEINFLRFFIMNRDKPILKKLQTEY